MIDDGTPVSLVGVRTQTGVVTGKPINGYAYVRWDDGGGNNVDVNRLIEVTDVPA